MPTPKLLRIHTTLYHVEYNYHATVGTIAVVNINITTSGVIMIKTIAVITITNIIITTISNARITSIINRVFILNNTTSVRSCCNVSSHIMLRRSTVVRAHQCSISYYIMLYYVTSCYIICHCTLLYFSVLFYTFHSTSPHGIALHYATIRLIIIL